MHNDVIDNSTKPRTAGAIALMSSGNLEGPLYYMLLANECIVKRTKATVLPMHCGRTGYTGPTRSTRSLRLQYTYISSTTAS